MSKTPQEIINKIPVLYKELGSKKRVAETLDISPATVSKYLKIFEVSNIDINGENVTRKPRTKITDELIEKINNKYSEYGNMSKVAKELGISSSTVKKYLNEENNNLRKNYYDDRDALYYYIIRLFGIYSEDEPVSKWNLTQITKFKNEGMSFKAQLLTLKYWFEILKKPLDKSNGSVGIIPYIYSQAKLYYETQVKNAEEINRAIKEQLEKDRIEIPYTPWQKSKKNNKRKKEIDLNMIEGDEE